MKKLIALLAVTMTASGAFAQAGNGLVDVGEQGLVVGFDFNNLNFDGGVLDENFNPVFQVDGLFSDVNGDRLSAGNPAAYVPRGAVYFNGTRGSDTWDSNFALTTVDGAVGGWNSGFNNTNRIINTPERLSLTPPLGGTHFETLDPSGPGSGGNPYSLGFNSGAGIDRVTFGVNTIGFEDIQVTFAAAMLNAAVPVSSSATLTWYFSLDGGLTAASTGLSTTVTGTVFTTKSFNFSSIAAYEQSPEALLILEITGSAGNDLLLLDNVQIIGTAVGAIIPEPSTYAVILGALVIGFIAYRRRQQIAA